MLSDRAELMFPIVPVSSVLAVSIAFAIVPVKLSDKLLDNVESSSVVATPTPSFISLNFAILIPFHCSFETIACFYLPEKKTWPELEAQARTTRASSYADKQLPKRCAHLEDP